MRNPDRVRSTKRALAAVGGIGAVVFLVIVAAAVIESCSGVTWADRRRANDIASNPLFDRLSETWSPIGERRVSPSSQIGAGVNHGRVTQTYDIGDLDNPINALPEVVDALREEGWVNIRVMCPEERRPDVPITALGLDGRGELRFSLLLYPPGQSSAPEAIDAGWVGVAMIELGFVEDIDDEFYERIVVDLATRVDDLGCLT